MVRRGAVALLAAALLTTLPAPASGKTSLQAQVSLSGAWTDNILAAPDLLAPGQLPPQADFYFDIRPGLYLTTSDARSVQKLGYTFGALLYASHSEANSYNQRLDWMGFFQLGKTTKLILGTAITQGQVNTFNLSLGSAATTVMITPPGGTEYLGATVTERFVWDITAQWRFLQSLTYNSYYPLSPRSTPDTYEIDDRFGAERGWLRDALAAELRVDYADFTELRGPGVDGNGAPVGNVVVTPEQRLIVTGAVLKWRHDFGHFWGSELDGGFAEANRADDTGAAIVEPAALAAIRYLHPDGSLELVYTHSISPNAIAAGTFSMDNVALRGSLPIGRTTNLLASGTAAYQYGRELDYQTGGVRSGTHLVVADATLGWTPRVEIQIFARYQFIEQFGNPADLAPVASYLRHSVLLGVIGTWPGEAAATVPSLGQRVDRADAVTIPDPHQAPPK